MNVASRSRTRVQERLEHLQAEYGSVEVTQTTFEVGAGRYERAVENSRDGHLDIRVVVHNQDGTVRLGDGDGVPSGRTRPEERIDEAVRRIVRQTTGVDCLVTDATTAEIHGIRNAETGETVYRLSVVFAAEIAEKTLRREVGPASRPVTPRR